MSEPIAEIRRKTTERAERDRRLAAALRENLRRRKEQARGTQDTQGTAPPEGGEKEPQRSA